MMGAVFSAPLIFAYFMTRFTVVPMPIYAAASFTKVIKGLYKTTAVTSLSSEYHTNTS
jgi:hypothetical protein